MRKFRGIVCFDIRDYVAEVFFGLRSVKVEHTIGNGEIAEDAADLLVKLGHRVQVRYWDDETGEWSDPKEHVPEE